jgi:hypothetical protein
MVQVVRCDLTAKDQNLGSSAPHVKPPQQLHDVQRKMEPMPDVRYATLYMM